MGIPFKKSPYKDVTDWDYSAATHADEKLKRTNPKLYDKLYTPAYAKVGRGIGKLIKRGTSNFKELARLAKQNLRK